MIVFVCPSCSRKLKVDEALAGKKARCPSCGQASVIPLNSLATTPPTRSYAPRTESIVEANLVSLPSGEAGASVSEETVPPRSGSGSAAGETVPPHHEVEPDPLATTPPVAGRSHPAADALTPPGYEILRELGRGGMGVVYQARQTRLGRTVALKMILSGGHASEDDLARFRTEAEAIARLQHPNIVQIYEIGDCNGLPFFSLEFCGGGSLDRKLNGTPLVPEEAAKLVRTLAEAMQAAHTADVIHRDLKPANVLLAGEQRGGSPRGVSPPVKNAQDRRADA